MHLSTLQLDRFRSFQSGEIQFDPYLTALVGENNGGKSNVVDALRLLTLPANGRRDLYCEDNDVRRGEPDNWFKLTATYQDLSPAQRGLLISATPGPTEDKAVFGVDFGPGLKRNKPHYWAGKFGGDAEPGAGELIRHVYLPPLRDAQRALASGNPSRITALLKHFLDEAGEAKFKQDLRRNEKTQALDDINSSVMTVLNDLTGGVRPQSAALGLSDGEEVYDIARDLRFKLADAGVTPEDLRHSGLGYANLLFMTTVMVELAKAKEADLTLFLVEEPEAHLHPQLQMLVLDFLQEKAIASASKPVEAGQPAGRVQVVVTTHSPNLTAWIDPKNLVVLKSVSETPQQRPRSQAIAISQLGMRRRSVEKISRYIDTTRSALLFGGRTLLLEGMAEALLIPAFAKRMFKSRKEAGADREAWKKLQGATIIAIDGVDFVPYLELLLRPVNNCRIGDRVVVVTDNDPKVKGDRAAKLAEHAGSFGAKDQFACYTNQVTLELALFTDANEALLKAVYLDLRPQSLANWQSKIEAVTEADRPTAFLALFSGDNPLRKGDFAQALAYRLAEEREEGDVELPKCLVDKGNVNDPEVVAFLTSYVNFEIPVYLQDAIRAITK